MIIKTLIFNFIIFINKISLIAYTEQKLKLIVTNVGLCNNY